MNKRIAIIGVVSHSSCLAYELSKRIAEKQCNQGEIIIIREVEEPKIIMPYSSAPEVDLLTPIAVIPDKPSPVYDFKRIRKAKRK